jgi:hypothetical protein
MRSPVSTTFLGRAVVPEVCSRKAGRFAVAGAGAGRLSLPTVHGLNGTIGTVTWARRPGSTTPSSASTAATPKSLVVKA